MSVTEFLAAAIIALYAMAGGAIMASAVSSSVRALRAIEKLMAPTWGIAAFLLFFGSTAAEFAYETQWWMAVSRPVLFICSGHLAFLVLLYVSRWLARSLSNDDRDQNTSGPDARQ